MNSVCRDCSTCKLSNEYTEYAYTRELTWSARGTGKCILGSRIISFSDRHLGRGKLISGALEVECSCSCEMWGGPSACIVKCSWMDTSIVEEITP